MNMLFGINTIYIHTHVNAMKNPTTIQDFDSMTGKENCKPILPDNITIYVI